MIREETAEDYDNTLHCSVDFVGDIYSSGTPLENIIMILRVDADQPFLILLTHRKNGSGTVFLSVGGKNSDSLLLSINKNVATRAYAHAIFPDIARTR